MYEVRKIDVSAWSKTYAETLATASTWKELLAKENISWYIGKGSDIFRNGVRIGHVDDLTEAKHMRYDYQTGKHYPVRLKDLLEASKSEV